MIEGVLNQKATWKKASGYDKYGKVVFLSDEIISVRWEGKITLVRNEVGDQVVSQSKVICKASINPGDVLVFNSIPSTVIAVNSIPDLSGRVLFREVYC